MLISPPIKLKRLRIASVAAIVNTTDELPNSMISCLCLFNTSFVATLAVTVNAAWDNLSCLIITSMNLKNSAVVLRMISILSKFHQALSVYLQLSASNMLYTFWIMKTYANGTMCSSPEKIYLLNQKNRRLVQSQRLT